MSLFLQWVRFRISSSQNVNFFGFYLDGLSGSRRIDQGSGYFNAGAGGDLFQHLFAELCNLSYYLDGMDDGTVVKSNKVYVLVSPFRPDPSPDQIIFTCLF